MATATEATDATFESEVEKASELTIVDFWATWCGPCRMISPILDQIVQVTRGSKNKELAWKFIDAYISPEVQLAFATELFWSPTNKTVKVPPEVAKEIVSGPADVAKLVLFEWAYVAKQRPQWTEKWNKEMR